ncbi:hypothetical protein ACC711_39340, partial [Rhizobium ruizarguesonis]
MISFVATVNRLRIAFPGEEAFGRKHANERSREHKPVPGAGSGYLVMKSDGTVLLSDLAEIFR